MPSPSQFVPSSPMMPHPTPLVSHPPGQMMPTDNHLMAPPPKPSSFLTTLSQQCYMNKLYIDDNKYDFDPVMLAPCKSISLDGFVNLYFHLQLSKFMAGKSLKLDVDSKKQKYILRELELFKEFKNVPNIVQFYGCGLYSQEGENRLMILMEYCNTTLHDFYIKLLNGHCNNPNHDFSTKILSFNENLLGVISVAMNNGLIHLSHKKIMHRDIKPPNVLMSKTLDGKFAVKLCDFGRSRLAYLMDGADYTMDVGTRGYRGPEILSPKVSKDPKERNKPNFYDMRADVYSLSVTLFEVVTGIRPISLCMNYPKSDPEEIECAKNIILMAPIWVKELMLDYSQDAKDFVLAGLTHVEKRPSVYHLKNFAFYKKYEKVDMNTVLAQYARYIV